MRYLLTDATQQGQNDFRVKDIVVYNKEIIIYEVEP